MSRTSNRNDGDDMEGSGSERDGGVPEKNEYEAMRDANVARIQTRLQPALDASKALSESFSAAKRNLNRRRIAPENAPPRRSGRLGRVAVATHDDLVNVDGGEESEEHGRASENATTDYVSEDSSASETDASDEPEGRGLEREDCNALKRKLNYGEREGVLPGGKRRIFQEEGVSQPGFAGRTPRHDDQLPTRGSSSSFIPSQEFTWVQIPKNAALANLFNVGGAISQVPLQGSWQFHPTQLPQPQLIPMDSGIGVGKDGTNSVSSSVREDSEKRRIRRTRRKEAEDEALKRENAGLRPFAVEVKPSGVIDSGCRGYLKWQESVRDLTPRMLDMSIFKYEDQNVNSRNKLRDTLFAKFEFEGNELTQSAYDKIIKNWMRKERSRVKRAHAGKVTRPSKYPEQAWENMKKKWNTDESKLQSEKMSETRKKVAIHPRVGRQGYAGQQAKVRREREVTPGLTDLADDRKTSEENPSSAEMERKNATRLSVMERTQAETNRRLEDIHSILQTVLTTLAGSESDVPPKVSRPENDTGGPVSPSSTSRGKMRECSPQNDKNQDQYWDILLKSSDEEDHGDSVKPRNTINTIESGVQGKKKRDSKMKTAAANVKVPHKAPTVQRQGNQSQERTAEEKETRDEPIKQSGAEKQKSTDNDRQEVEVGNKVWLALKDSQSDPAAFGVVTAKGGEGTFHCKPIPQQYVRVNVEAVMVNQPLMVPVEEADQFNLSDALGSSVLWLKNLTFARN